MFKLRDRFPKSKAKAAAEPLPHRGGRVLSALALAAVAISAPASAQTGESLFGDNCSACHQANGQGVQGAFPALAGDPFVTGDPDALVAVVLKGRGGMPTFKDDLKDPEIAAILTYIRGAWGNKAAAVAPAQVAAGRAKIGPSTQRGLQAH
jgi:mono/diheme cytochrome c family protein